MWACEFFLSVKFAASLLALLAWGITWRAYNILKQSWNLFEIGHVTGLIHFLSTDYMPAASFIHSLQTWFIPCSTDSSFIFWIHSFIHSFIHNIPGSFLVQLILCPHLHSCISLSWLDTLIFHTLKLSGKALFISDVMLIWAFSHLIFFCSYPV